LVYITKTCNRKVSLRNTRNKNILTMQCVEPLLCNNREMEGYTRAVLGQRIRKHVPTATNRRVTMEVFFGNGIVLFGPRCIMSKDKFRT
jgi:hypothetical protein